jgi:hypothetical protein
MKHRIRVCQARYGAIPQGVVSIHREQLRDVVIPKLLKDGGEHSKANRRARYHGAYVIRKSQISRIAPRRELSKSIGHGL